MNKKPDKQAPNQPDDTQSSSPRRSRRYNRRRGDIQGDAPPWLVSFTDIMALMLTFFVLLYAMSTPEEKSWSEVMAALQKEFHVYYGPRQQAGPSDTINIERVNFNRALPLDYLESLLERMMVSSDENNQMTFRVLNDSLIISLPEGMLFAQGATEVNEGALRQLHTLSTSLSKIRNRIEIVGHSDPAPITNPNSAFPSNWELSLERGAIIAAILHKRGYTQPIAIKGSSSGRFDDMESDISQELREKYARRVDIHIMPDDGRRTIEQRLRLE